MRKLSVFSHPPVCVIVGIAFFASFGLLGTFSADAQQLPGPAEIDRPQVEIPELPDFELELEFSVELEGGQAPPPGQEEEEVDFNGLTFKGNTAFQGQDFEPFFKEYIGQSVTLSQLFGFTTEIDRKYRDAGYVLAFSFIPAQEVSDGVYEVEIVEGYVDNVVVEGVDGLLARKIRAVLRPVTESRPLQASVIERALLLVDDLAGVGVNGTLRPSAAAGGASELVVQISHKLPRASLSLDNRGSRFAGPMRWNSSFGLDSPIGLGESLTLSALVTTPKNKEQQFVSMDVVFPFANMGTTIKSSTQYSVSQPGSTLDALDVQSKSFNSSFEVRHPFLRSREHNINVYAGLNWKDSQTDILDADLSRDHLRTLHWGGSFSQSGWLGGASNMDMKFTHGMDIFGATEGGTNGSRADGVNDFTKISLNAVHLQPIWDRFSGVFSATAQRSFSDALLSGEEMSLGGAAYGRAYDSGEITGETGLGLSAEVRYDIPVANLLKTFDHEIAKFATSAIKSAQVYTFTDFASVWDHETVGGQSTLTSAGGGLRVSLPYNLNLSFEYAVPVSEKVAAQGAPGDQGRSFVSLSWSY